MKLCEHSKTIVADMNAEDREAAKRTLDHHFTNDEFRRQFKWEHLSYYEFQWSFGSMAEACEDVNELLRALLRVVCDVLQMMADNRVMGDIEEFKYVMNPDYEDSMVDYDPYKDLQDFIDMSRQRVDSRRDGRGMDDWLLKSEVRNLLRRLRDGLKEETLESWDKSDGRTAHPLLLPSDDDDVLFQNNVLQVGDLRFQHQPPSIYLGRFRGDKVPYAFDFDLCAMFVPGAVAFLEVLNLFLGNGREDGVPSRLRGAGLIDVTEESEESSSSWEE